MGLYARLDAKMPNSLGLEAEPYADWPMVNIIEKFASEDWTDLNVRLRFRKALLISHEAQCLARREHFYV